MQLDKSKVLVIGFDGASPRLAEQWIDDLPAFRAFKEQGILGQTIPPIPAQTPVAWATFATGKNPGNHRIFSFTFRQIGTYDRKIIQPTMLKSKTLWQMLNEADKRVGIINLPMSDAEDVKGFIIPGFISPSEGIPYPDRIKEKVKKRFGIDRISGDVEIDVLDRVKSDPELFFERVDQITDEMAEVSLFLMEEEKWDFFMTVFMGMDRIQHFFWKHVDSTHPDYEPGVFTRLVKGFYTKADKIVGKFLQAIDENTRVVLVSDHGFCPVSKEIIVNNYLEEAGFLTRTSGKIDLERSKAVSYGYGDIWLNVKGREPCGIIDPQEDYDAVRSEIKKSLQEIKVEGIRPFRDVKEREKLYWGTYLKEAPDLTAIFNVGWQAARQPEIAPKNASLRYVNDNPKWNGGHDGTHDPLDVPGLFGIRGDGIQAGKQLRVPLWDLAPTLLELLKVETPSDMDGKSFLAQIMKESTQSL